jgi:drug/metabolite transporter (DMT)-like permease
LNDRNGTRPASAWQIAAALAAVYVVWGSTYLAIRIAIESLPPFWMASGRFVIAGALLYGFARWRGAERPTAEHWRSAALVGTLLLGFGNGGVVWAEQRVDSGVAALIVSTVPLWMVVLDWLRPGGVRPRLGVFAGLALGFVGLVLLIRPSSAGAIDLIGVGVLMLGSLGWAWGSLQSRFLRLPESPLLATAMEMLTGSVALGLLGAVTGESSRFHLSAVTPRSWLAVLYLILIGALVGYTAYVWLLRVASPALVSTYAYVNPVVAVLLGWAFASEPLTAKTLGAAAVILTGVALITISRGRTARKERREEREAVCLAAEETA